MEQGLVKLDAIKTELARATELDDVLNIRDKAHALHIYAKARKMEELADIAKEGQLRAERAAGEYLERMPKNVGGRPKTCDIVSQVFDMPTYTELGISRKQSSRWQLQASVPEPIFEEWVAETKSNGRELTATGLRKLAKKLQGNSKMAVHFSSDSIECYTPEHIIDRVIGVMGGIDLDPCAPVKGAAYYVPASKHYTTNEDGLAHDWHGRVYMNPPYGRVIDDWIGHLIEQYRAENVTEAIALVPSRTDTQWFRSLREFPRCFVWGRLRFRGQENSAPFPSMVVYLGEDVETFVCAFGDIGDVYSLLD